MIKLLEWVAENHYILYNIENGIYYWKNENETITSGQLLEKFLEND